jgi:hypothetical protein
MSAVAMWQSTASGAGIFVVTNLADDHHLPLPPGSLRQAIIDASSSGGGDIVFSNVSGSINLRIPLPTITNNINIFGPGASLLSVRADNVYYGLSMLTVSTGALCKISGLTFRDGYYGQTSFGGGAILNVGGSLFLTDCVITNNISPGWSIAVGGGISSIGGLLSCSNCIISGNIAYGNAYIPGTATNGGWAFGGGIYSQGGTLLLADCIITNNTALGGRGELITSGNAKAGGDACRGAVCNLGGLLWMTNCLITMNSVTGGTGGYNSFNHIGADGGSGFGGGVYERGGTNLLFNVNLTRNRAQGGDGGGKPDYWMWTIFGSDGNACGGAAAGKDGMVVMTDCLVTGNDSVGLPDGLGGGAFGGGLYQDGGILNLNRTQVSANTAIGAFGFGYSYNYPERGVGGAVYNNATAHFTNCTFSGNVSAGGSTLFAYYGNTGKPGYGGAVYNSGSICAVSCSFLGNATLGGRGTIDRDHAGYVIASGNGMGGAIYNDHISVLIDCLFSDNNACGGDGNSSSASATAKAAGWGGGIFNGGSCLITTTTVCRNVANGGRGISTSGIPGEDTNGHAGEGNGGGIFNSGTLSILNSTFYANSTTGGNDVWTGGAGRGGAIYNGTNSAQLNHCTVAGNAATGGTGQSGSSRISTGGGIYNNGVSWLRNSILASNSPGSNYFGVVTDASYNLSSDANCVFTNIGSSINTDPLLGPFANNGGSTPTMALLPNSPAIDRGAADGVFTDQRGQPRPCDILGIPNAGDGSDIGAFEYISYLPVLVTAWGLNGDGQAQVRADVTQVKAIAAGAYHSLALRADGSVVTWGRNDFGEIVPPSDLTNATAIAGGWGFSLALKSNHSVASWGWPAVDATHFPPGMTNVVAIAAGWDHALALRADGTVLAWGSNSHGQTNVPSGLSGVVAIAGGGSHSLALRRDGSVVAWGDDGAAQINVPSGLTSVAAIAAGASHYLVLKWDGTVVAWGDNSYGQTDVPLGLTNVVAIAAGDYHSLALCQNGMVVGWGWNGDGQATLPAGVSNVVAIAAGRQHSLVLVGDGSPWITVQPFNQAALPGETVQFGVMASGAPVLSYQWFKDSLMLSDNDHVSGVTSPILVLSDFATVDTGIYSVIVTNPFGSTVSLLANLVVRTVWFGGVRCLEPGKIALTICGLPGDVYCLQASTNLLDWESVGTVTNVTGTVEFMETPASGYNQRFYRLVLP